MEPLIQSANPFPGLRPFEPDETDLFFGREDQCDQLLARLGQRRMVAVVGASGSGKSSLVRAGLIPALESGYLPSAGTSWRIGVCRPGSDPIGNLATSLNQRRADDGSPAAASVQDIRSLLDRSSLGLVDCARHLLGTTSDSLLVVVDQFEELFRFSRGGGAAAAEDVSSFIGLLIATAHAHDAPVYIVLTMRSDYLGDCGKFVGLPDALNDSQFLVPQMTREQLKEAIEGPISVRGARITRRLVQRLLHDVEQLANEERISPATMKEADPLPLLQHALMRAWDVSSAARRAGEPIDLSHYENPPVCTVSHSLDLHAEEALHEVEGTENLQIVERVFRRLTERDPGNRDIRRPTSLEELAAVAFRVEDATVDQRERVRSLLQRFAKPGRSFLFVDRQNAVDISHESLIRQWSRLGSWVEQEATSKRIYTSLSEWADGWERRRRALYRGPELTEALEWVKSERPTEVWAKRYGGALKPAMTYLAASRRARALRRLAIAAAVVTLILLAGLYERSQRVLTAQKAANRQLDRLVFDLKAEADKAAKSGNTAAADKLTQVATTLKSTGATRSDLPPDELKELESLRSGQKQWNAEREKLLQTNRELQSAVDRLSPNPLPGRGATETPAPTLAPTPAPVQTPLQLPSSAVQGPFVGPVGGPPKATVSEEQQILATLALYAKGYADGKLDEVRSAYPSLVERDQAALQRVFDDVSHYVLTISEPSVTLQGAKALVRATVQESYVSRKADRPRTNPPAQRVFSLEKQNDRWIITHLQ